MRKLIFLTAALIVACTAAPDSFQHDLIDGNAPWTKEPISRPSNKFTFAIIGDLYSGERPGVFNIAVEQINLLSPEFVISVGDLVEGGTEELVELDSQFDRFDQMVSKLQAPFFHVGGNHDLTNPAMRIYWEGRYGRRYYHFVFDNVLFLVIDSEDYSEQRMQQIYEARAKAIEVLDGPNPENAREMEYFKMPERVSGEIGDEQSAYFEKVISDNPDVRWTFLFMHKPVWKREGDHNLSRIEKALANQSFTVIGGHLHEYVYSQQNERDYITLATTSGQQNILSENAFDHITLVTMKPDGPSWVNLRMDGMLDKTGHIPLGGDSLCFQASRCREE